MYINYSALYIHTVCVCAWRVCAKISRAKERECVRHVYN